MDRSESQSNRAESEGGLTPNRTTPGGPGVTSENAATSATDPTGYGGGTVPQEPVNPGDEPEPAR